jgi:hypothetical protein
MASIRIGIAVAFALGMTGLNMPAASAAETVTRKIDCTLTLQQYNEALWQLHALADQARAMAQQNPLYESDLKYYASVLMDAYECAKNAAPVTTASR